MQQMIRTCIVAVAFTCLRCIPAAAQTVALRDEYAKTMIRLADALLKRQAPADSGTNAGAIYCAHCNVWHTRAAEAVFPFTMSWKVTGNKQYLRAALDVANWLFQQQQPNGSWKETPEEWTGTTTDQLLMLLLSYEQLQHQLTPSQQQHWREAMKKAADYLEAVMRPEFASINYVCTTTATLAEAFKLFHDKRYLDKARALAHRTLAKMDEDGFIDGEGGKSHGNKMGVDLGYEMEMSLWGLGLYARLANDTVVDAAVAHSLQQHLYFIYPDGSLDGSWGIRSNKWTGYGGATSDGCQVLFSLFADRDPRYATASWRNLQYLRTNIAGDLIGYGPQQQELFSAPPCIYPTFAKAKNLAMAYLFETKAKRPMPPVPADKIGWMKLFPTLDVVVTRTKNFMSTITAYQYKDQYAGWKGKYMYRADGGAMSHVWLKGFGMLQASSPTVYTRPEPMSFPEAPGVKCLTPRIEYTDTSGYYTNLYEFDARLDTGRTRDGFVVKVNGQLKDKNWLTGGVGYSMQYVLADSYYEKKITLVYHDAWPAVTIIEPFMDDGSSFSVRDDQHVEIKKGNTIVVVELLTPGLKWIAGRDREHYWTPYPAVKAYPLEIEVPAAEEPGRREIKYRVQLKTRSEK